MFRRVYALAVLCALVCFPALVSAQEAMGELKLLDWKPKSQLVVNETMVLRPKFPVFDVHNHMRRLDMLKTYLAEMDKAGVVRCVSLDGMSKDDFYKKHIEASRAVSAERLLVFFSPNFEGIDDPKWAEREIAKLKDAVRLGARGVKIFKELGLVYRDNSGKLIPVDDPRIDPFWDAVGQLKIPVMIHVSDPKAFFTPVDKYNERYDELGAHPDWAFGDTTKYPSKWEILAQRNRMFAKHPNTIYIGAHMGTLPEELHQVGMWLDAYPNFYVDIDARISELGRQPYTCRKFLIQYQDRVMFGTDTPPNAESYRIYYRFLETWDEYFDPAGGHHLQGRWMIYGVGLPDEVLEKIYHLNADKIFARFQG
ncbi:amidohydrolase [bacterium]|nr:amidohydrolase [bacterium]